jgi:RNA polymerase sigma factor (sigma-70 family)
VETEAFLSKAVFNLSVDRVRRKREHLYEKQAVEELVLPALTPSPEEEAANEECMQRTAKMLDETVGERARHVFFLHCFEGLTYAEIAKKIKKSTITVERDIAKAINCLTMQELE